MIVFDKLWITMKNRGISTYQLREKCGIDSKTVRRLRANENVETKTLEKLSISSDLIIFGDKGANDVDYLADRLARLPADQFAAVEKFLNQTFELFARLDNQKQ